MISSSLTGSSSRMTAPAPMTPPAVCWLQLDDDAAHGRAHLDAVDHVPGGADLLLQVVQLRLGGAHAPRSPSAPRRSAAARSAARRAQCAPGRRPMRAVSSPSSPVSAASDALHGQNLGPAHELLRQQALLVLQLLGEQRHALLRRLRLRGIAADALLQARDLLAQHLLFGRRLQRGAPATRRPGARRCCGSPGRAASAASSEGIANDGRPSISASSRAFMMSRRWFLSTRRRSLAAGGGGVEAQQRLAVLDQVALLAPAPRAGCRLPDAGRACSARWRRTSPTRRLRLPGAQAPPTRRSRRRRAPGWRRRSAIGQRHAGRHAAMPFVDAGAGASSTRRPLSARAVRCRQGGLPLQAAGAAGGLWR